MGRTFAAIFVAEIGDVTRFPGPRQLVLVGRPDAQALRVRHHRAPWGITKQGSPLVRWAAIEATGNGGEVRSCGPTTTGLPSGEERPKPVSPPHASFSDARLLRPS